MFTLFVVVVFAVVVYSALIRWWIQLDSATPDGLQLRELRRAGADLSAEHEVEFYAGCRDEASARSVAERLEQEGFDFELLEEGEHIPWEIIVRHRMVPTEPQLVNLGQRLRNAAEANGCEYGGWDTWPVPSIRTAGMKVAAAMVTLVLVGHVIEFMESGGLRSALVLGLLLIGLPLLIVTVGDLGHACRTAPTSRIFRVVGFIIGLPQVLFAVLAIAIGISIVGWVLYNTFIEKQPEYTGGFLTFGVAPVMLIVGITWLRRLFAGKGRGRKEDAPVP